MANPPVKEVAKYVRPLLSSNKTEARRRVLKLFKDWCREIEHMNVEYELPMSYDEAVAKIKSEFLKHKDVPDIRVIDMLILKSRAELFDTKNRYKFMCQFYYDFDKNQAAKPKDFLKQFLSSPD